MIAGLIELTKLFMNIILILQWVKKYFLEISFQLIQYMIKGMVGMMFIKIKNVGSINNDLTFLNRI